MHALVCMFAAACVCICVFAIFLLYKFSNPRSTGEEGQWTGVLGGLMMNVYIL